MKLDICSSEMMSTLQIDRVFGQLLFFRCSHCVSGIGCLFAGKIQTTKLVSYLLLVSHLMGDIVDGIACHRLARTRFDRSDATAPISKFFSSKSFAHFGKYCSIWLFKGDFSECFSIAWCSSFGGALSNRWWANWIRMAGRLASNGSFRWRQMRRILPENWVRSSVAPFSKLTWFQFVQRCVACVYAIVYETTKLFPEPQNKEINNFVFHNGNFPLRLRRVCERLNCQMFDKTVGLSK